MSITVYRNPSYNQGQLGIHNLVNTSTQVLQNTSILVGSDLKIKSWALLFPLVSVAFILILIIAFGGWFFNADRKIKRRNPQIKG